MRFNRALGSRVLNPSHHFKVKVVVLTGARQTGKTTLLLELFARHK